MLKMREENQMLMEHVVMVKVGQQAHAHCFYLSVCLLPPESKSCRF
jgi:hypothetical protein